MVKCPSALAGCDAALRKRPRSPGRSQRNNVAIGAACGRSRLVLRSPLEGGGAVIAQQDMRFVPGGMRQRGIAPTSGGEIGEDYSRHRRGRWERRAWESARSAVTVCAASLALLIGARSMSWVLTWKPRGGKPDTGKRRSTRSL